MPKCKIIIRNSYTRTVEADLDFDPDDPDWREKALEAFYEADDRADREEGEISDLVYEVSHIEFHHPQGHTKFTGSIT